jgi:hypothetical protein
VKNFQLTEVFPITEAVMDGLWSICGMMIDREKRRSKRRESPKQENERGYRNDCQ